MKHLMIAAAALATAPLALDAAPLDYTDPFSSYIAFGDSLTDDGKAGTLAPPSFGGRFSNGITYAEHIAADFAANGKASANFAIGGATAELDNETPYPDAASAAIGTFTGQIGTFNFLEKTTALGAALGDNPLISVLFGANDLFQDLTEGTMPGDIGKAAANAVQAGIRALNALDAKFDDFVVINLPDLSTVPNFANPLFPRFSEAGEAKTESLAFNAQLATNMQDLRDQDGLNIVEVDMAGFLAGILAAPGSLNVDIPCTTTLLALDLANNCAVTPTGIDISLADNFLFVDPVHPNRIAQAAFADQVRVALVPLPAGLTLMLTMMGGLLLLRRRAQA